MEVILLENIDDLGTVGETVKVKPGFARNFLIPRKFACLATQKNRNYYQALIETGKRKLAKAKASAEELGQQMSAITLTFLRKSQDEESRLFGSVTNADIADALAEKDIEIDRRKISLSEPIKKLGEYKAFVKLHPEVTAEVTIVVGSEDQEENAD